MSDYNVEASLMGWMERRMAIADTIPLHYEVFKRMWAHDIPDKPVPNEFRDKVKAEYERLKRRTL